MNERSAKSSPGNPGARERPGPSSAVMSALAAALLLTACGDWPWPMENPDDQQRCDPACNVGSSCKDGICVCLVGYAGDKCDKCEVGYKGYPTCVKDPCYPEKCNNHGTCSEGVCTCNTGYAGDDCGECDKYYTGYPNCTKVNCQCNDGVSPNTCIDDSTVKTCKNCLWSTVSCSSICSAQGKKSSGCGTDPITSAAACYCADPGHDLMLVVIMDGCQDGGSPTGSVFNMTSKGHYGEKTIPDGATQSWKIQCVTGDSICWGLWQGNYYWGCGKNCSEKCTSPGACCKTCGSQLVWGIKTGC